MPLYYHYTGVSALPAIINSNMLLESTRAKTGDAMYGDGVYFTQLSPLMHPSAEIYFNNWAQRLSDNKHLPKLAVCFEIKYDGKNMTEVGKNHKRDVWVYKGEDLPNLLGRLQKIYVNAELVDAPICKTLNAYGCSIVLMYHRNGKFCITQSVSPPNPNSGVTTISTDSKDQVVTLTANGPAFVAPCRGRISMDARLRGTEGHWHITLLRDGASKLMYFRLLHPSHSAPMYQPNNGVSASGTCEVSPNDSLTITAGANIADVWANQVEFSASFVPL